jgi:uncharacterized membrane protein YhaH (DUF805 family)
MKWYFRVLKKYATFNGRARRKEYWMFVFLNIFVSLGITLATELIALIGFTVGRGGRIDVSDMRIAAGVSLLVSIVYSLAVLIPSIAVAVRRMHDAGRSGWWILFPLVNFIFLLVGSQPGENGYGPNPMAEFPRNTAQAAYIPAGGTAAPI